MKILRGGLERHLRHSVCVTYVKCDVHFLSVFIDGRVNITEVLDSIHRVDVHIPLERLAECLDLFSAAPDAFLSRFSHSSVEATLLIPGREGRGTG